MIADEEVKKRLFQYGTEGLRDLRTGAGVSNPRRAVAGAIVRRAKARMRFIAKGERASSDARTNWSPQTSAVFVRPVGDRCNLACAYCYQTEIRQFHSGRRMSPELLRSILEQVAEVSRGAVSIAWHGGEPLLAGKPFFREAISLIPIIFPDPTLVTNSVQTSGVLLDAEWLEMFKRAGFVVGLSLDGPKEMNDARRVDKRGLGTFDQVARAVRLAQSLGVRLNAICVVSDHNGRHPDRFLRTMSDLDLAHCNIQPDFSLNGDTPWHVDPAIFANFVIRFWNEWSISPHPLSVSLFENFIDIMLGGLGFDCVFSGRCSDLVAVSNDGSVRPCSRPVESRFAQFGSVTKAKLSEIVADAAATDFRSADERSQRNHGDCQYFRFCNHGCPQHRVTDGRADVGGSNVFCGCANSSGHGYNEIWRHLSESLISLTKQVA